MKLPIAQIDAFASTPFTGNPAAVMPLPGWLDDATLQAIAAENNLAETAFLVPIAAGDGADGADYELRWFTPAAEVQLCGHATLASGHFLLAADPARARVVFRTRQAGLLSVARAESGYALALPAWAPSPAPLPEIVAALGVTDVVETLAHPHRYGVVVLADEAAVRAVTPDFRALAAAGGWLAIVTAPGEASDIVSRAFAPAFGIDEDPVTGSAHAVLAPYWARRLGRDAFTAYQASARGGHLSCRVDADRVVLGGACVTVLEGSFFV